jgi:hypothetical protein
MTVLLAIYTFIAILGGLMVLCWVQLVPNLLYNMLIGLGILGLDVIFSLVMEKFYPGKW